MRTPRANHPLSEVSAVLLASTIFLPIQSQGEDTNPFCCDGCPEPKQSPAANPSPPIGKATLGLPDDLPDSFSVKIPFAGQYLTLKLEKNQVFGPNTKFLVADEEHSGKLTSIDPGLDRSYLGRVAERPDFTVSAVLSESGLIANILRPYQETVTVTPLLGSEGGMHQISLGDSGDHMTTCHDCYDDVAGSSVGTKATHDETETAASNGAITAILPMLANVSGGSASTATRRPSRVMDVLEYEIGVEIGSRAFLSTTYGSNLATAQASAQSIIGNLDARYLRATGIKHRLGTVIIRTSAASDPLRNLVTATGAGSEASRSLAAFRDYWNDNPGEVGTTHDLAIYHVRFAPSGLAYVNSVGSRNRYATSGSNGATAWADGIATHEFGHSWSLSHVNLSRGSSFYESKPRNFSGSSAAGGSDVFISIMDGRGAHNISRLSTGEANQVFNVRQGKRNFGTVLANPGQIPPFGHQDEATTSDGNPITIDVIANDYDCNNDVLDVQLLDTVSQQGGTIRLSRGTGPGGRNRLRYSPPSGHSGVDFFHYTVCDTSGRTDWGAVYVTNSDTSTGDFVDQDEYRWDFGTVGSPVFASYRPITEFTSRGFVRWTNTNGLDSRDRGGSTGNNLNRDFVFGSAARTLRHQVTNGRYEVVLNMFDGGFSRDDMRVRIEGVVRLSNIDTSPPNNNQTRSVEVDVTDGFLDIEFSDTGGANNTWVVNRLIVKKVGTSPPPPPSGNSTGSFVDRNEYLWDFGTSDSPLFTNYRRITHETNAGFVRWTNTSGLNSRDRGGSTGNNLNRDFVFGSAARTLRHQVTNGRYEVTLNMFDGNFSRDDMRVRLEGVVRLSNIDTSPPNNNQTRFAEVDVTDGFLNIEFSDTGGANNTWVVNRLIVKKVTNSTPPGTQLRFDFGTGGSPLQAGWTRVTPQTRSGAFKWLSGGITARDRGSAGGLDNLHRDFNFDNDPRTFEIDVANGRWQTQISFADGSSNHDRMTAVAEGISFGEVDVNASARTRTISRDVTVGDGKMTIRFQDLGGSDPNWVVSRIQLTRL